MSTKEFDVERARVMYELRLRSAYDTASAAVCLGPALDALSAARKERDEARGLLAIALGVRAEPVTPAPVYKWLPCPICGIVDTPTSGHAHGIDACVTLASLAERVKAIEERIDNQPKGQS